MHLLTNLMTTKVNYLIDTHILLWYLVGDKRVTQSTRAKIESSDNSIFLSNASLWEIAIKLSIGKLKLNVSLTELNDYLQKQGLIILEFDFRNQETLQMLPFYHQDPFDRLIVSQAKTKSMEIITNDDQVLNYFRRK